MKFELEVLPDTLAVCRLESAAPVPDWAQGDFVSVTRSGDELSVVCREQDVPGRVQAERGWRGLRVAGKLDFSLVGVLAGLAGVLADAGVSVFAISTYDTDYLLVRQHELAEAVLALENAGHSVKNK